MNVTTGNNTNLKGSLLAAGSYDKNNNFVDNNNLNLTTKTLTFSNSTDSTYTSGNSFSLGTNIGFSKDVKDPQPKDDSTTKINSTNLAFSNSLGYQRNKTLATLGQGNVTITDTQNSDDTTSLNRDTQNISKTMINTSYGVKVDATLDHRLLSEDGRKQIAEDLLKTKMIANTVELIATTKRVGIQDFFSETEKTYNTYEALKKEIANSPELATALNSQDLTPSQKEQMLDEVTDAVMVKLGYTTYDNKLIDTDVAGKDGEQVKGYYSEITKDAYINDKYNDSTKDLISTAGHEATHAMDQQSNIQSEEAYSNNFGENLASYTNFVLNITNQGSMAQTNTHTQPQSALEYIQFQQNNSEFIELDKAAGDNLTIFVHGTYASPKTVNKEFIGAVGKTYGEDVYLFDWSGRNGSEGGESAENNTKARANAAINLTKYIENYEFKDEEKLNIIGHSHGGNVIKDFTQYYEGSKKIDNVTFLGTPVRSDYLLNINAFSNNAKIDNVYDGSDIVQRAGGFDDKGRWFAGQTINSEKVNNIKVESPNYNKTFYPTSILNLKAQLLEDHSNLDTVDVWEQKNEK